MIPLECPKSFVEVAHMDITYGDITAPGGIKNTFIIVDRKTRFTHTQPLKNYKGNSIIFALKKLKTMAGKVPGRFFTDFNTKILCETVTEFCTDNSSVLMVSPPDQQHQNGLVERT